MTLADKVLPAIADSNTAQIACRLNMAPLPDRWTLPSGPAASLTAAISVTRLLQQFGSGSVWHPMPNGNSQQKDSYQQKGWPAEKKVINGSFPRSLQDVRQSSWLAVF